MKPWIFKGLAYLATCGAAATTVLLTVSSVGLKKSKSDTFPNLSGLIQDRPDVKEDLLEPEKPKPKPVQPPPSPPAGSPDPAPDPSQKPSSGDDPQKPDATDDQAGQAGPGHPPGGPAGGAQGGVQGGTVGGIACENSPETILQMAKSLANLPNQYITMKDQTLSVASCVDQLTKQPSAPQSLPSSPVPGGSS